MDLGSTLSSLYHKRKAAERARFYNTYRRQNFDLPDSAMFYIAMNPATPKVYHSLVKACKYFFIKNPIIVLTNAFLHEKLLHVEVNYFTKYRNAIEWTKCASKYWITNEFLKPVLRLINLSITYDDYVYLSSTAEKIELLNVTVKDENGTILALEKIVEISAKVKRFEFYCNTTSTNITAKTVKKVIENLQFSRLEYFHLKNVPDTFDIESFYVYMKKNKTTSFHLSFDDTISEAY